jgi:hypothetical protein
MIEKGSLILYYFDEVIVNWICIGFKTFWLIEINFSFILFSFDAKFSFFK